MNNKPLLLFGIFLSFVLAYPFQVFAQSKTIKGNIMDETGIELEGVIKEIWFCVQILK